MIWVDGEIVPDDALSISVRDRTFEHGLGLFETLRTWNGHATLLDRHVARMTASAQDLDLPLDPASLPDSNDVAALLRAEGWDGDAVFRITMTGGILGEGSAVVWMKSMPLPSPIPTEGWSLISMKEVVERNPLSHHKTLNYWSRRLAFEQVGSGNREALLLSNDGLAWEGSRTNLFAIRGGTLVTPGLDGPILPGIMRGLVLERARSLAIPIREEEISLEDLRSAEEVFLTNSVRGIVPVADLDGQAFASPSPWTEKLQEDVAEWLNRGGIDP